LHFEIVDRETGCRKDGDDAFFRTVAELSEVRRTVLKSDIEN
jgi:hypothetical protein